MQSLIKNPKQRLSNAPAAGPSLSWFKKRTAALNKALHTNTTVKYQRTTYSPQAEYAAAKMAARVGATTEFVQMFSQDPRSKTGRAGYSAIGTLTAYAVRRTWAPLAARNYYIARLLNHMGDPDVVVDGNGNLWRVIYEDRIINGKPKTLEFYAPYESPDRLGTNKVATIPPPIRQLTPELANRLAAERARKINSRKDGSHSQDGDGSPFDSYLDM